MKGQIIICFILCNFGAVFCGHEACWMKVNAPQIFKALEKIDVRQTLSAPPSSVTSEDLFREAGLIHEKHRNRFLEKYAAARKAVHHHFVKKNFDQEMLQTMVKFRGAAQRELIKPQDPYTNQDKIPAGMNLGGRCMIRMPDSVLFFHRMKLRNNTAFQVKVLHNDLENMILKIHLGLNDLHLVGAYERTMTDRDPSALIYSPSFGELELLLKDVQFSVEARYKLIKARLAVEVVMSELSALDILLTHVKSSANESPMKLKKDNLGDIIQRLKTDLDKWLIDYLNDYLIFIDLEKVPSINQLQKYDKEKSAVLATFMDNAINIISKKIHTIGGSSIRVPQFSIVAAHGLKVKLYDGLLQGLDTMYRRSVVTTMAKRPNYRHINSMIGFSDLKVKYKYEVIFPAGSPSPTLTGVIVLSADELIGHLHLGMVKEPEVMEIDIDFLNQLGPNALTVEGAANLMISNFKHLLNHQILSLMSNTVIYGVDMLRSLPRCEPFVPGQLKAKPAPKLVKIQDNYAPNPGNYNIVNSQEEKEHYLREWLAKRS